MSGFFGNMFDFNRDGKLDCAEQAMEFMFLNKLLKDDEKPERDIFDDDFEDDLDDDW